MDDAEVKHMFKLSSGNLEAFRRQTSGTSTHGWAFGHDVVGHIVLAGKDTGRWLGGTRKLKQDSLEFCGGLLRKDSWTG